METVVCYQADSGREVWTQEIKSRFDDPMGGPGPRATPSIADGALFVLGANGQLMRLKSRTGEVVWQKDLRKVADREPPTWGFSSSPLIVDSSVIVHAGGANEKGILAFHISSGQLQWLSSSGDHSYSSPQRCTLAGEDVVLMLTNIGLDIIDPRTGQHRLKYDWKHNGYRAIQPHFFEDDSLLLATGSRLGTRRIRVARVDGLWKAEELWTTRHLKPDFNDFVIHQGYAYGFNGSGFTCIDLETGRRTWKKGQYGKGQVLLLERSGLLLISGEYGDVTLLKADPLAHTEVASFNAIEGKTWNHPVVVGDRLYIRNSQEAACYLLTLAEPAK